VDDGALAVRDVLVQSFSRLTTPLNALLRTTYCQWKAAYDTCSVGSV
jgi:hypothetical protein